MATGVQLGTLLSGAGLAFASKMIVAAGGLIFNAYLGRTFGVEGAGIFFSALTFSAIATVVFRLGLDNPVLRLTSEALAFGQVGQAAAIHRKSVAVVAAASAAGAVLILSGVGLGAILQAGNSSVLVVLAFMALGIPAQSMAVINAEVLRAHGRIVVPQFLYQGGVFLVLLPVVMFSSGVGIGDVAVYYAVATWVLFLFSWLLCRSIVPRDSVSLKRTSWNRLSAAARHMFVVSIMDVVSMWGALAILSFTAALEEVGAFGVASRAVLVVSSVLVALNVVAAPRFARLYAAEDIAKLARFSRLVTLTMVTLSAPILIGMVMFAEQVMRLFGAEFSSYAPILVILSIAHAVNVVTGPVGYLLMMCGHENQQRLASMAGAGVLLGLGILMVPLFGALGAAIATAAGIVTQNLVALLFVRKSLGFWTVGLSPRLGSVSGG